jgi:hypothetical protein
MDSKVNNIKNIIYIKKNIYPNLSNIWLNYIDEQIKQLYITLNKAEKIFNNLDKDISNESILLLYLLNNS